MSLLRAKLAQLVFNTPLLMHPGKVVAALTAIGGRIVEGGVEFDGGIEAIDHRAFGNGRPSVGRLGDAVGREYDRAGALPFDIVDGVAVIPIEGTLVHKGSYVGMASGETSYEGLQAQILRAGRAPNVKGVVFEVDSFGGQVNGAFETASMIARLSQAKPTLAILTDHAQSAGYLLARAARKVIIPQHGSVGSIGAVMAHVDYSAMLAQRGIKVTVLAAGAHKAEGNPYEPLGKDAADRWRAELETIRLNFARAVAGSPGSRLDEASALATEAAGYMGAAAVEARLADAEADPSEAFDAFLNAVNR
jgi:ClpP class serine protease